MSPSTPIAPSQTQDGFEFRKIVIIVQLLVVHVPESRSSLIPSHSSAMLSMGSEEPYSPSEASQSIQVSVCRGTIIASHIPDSSSSISSTVNRLRDGRTATRIVSSVTRTHMAKTYMLSSPRIVDSYRPQGPGRKMPQCPQSHSQCSPGLPSQPAGVSSHRFHSDGPDSQFLVFVRS